MADEYLRAALYGMKRFNEGASKKVKELIGMQKLIELLKEYDNEEFGEALYMENKVYANDFLIISKKFGFIQWLVENEKIEYRKIIEKEIEVGFKLVRIKDYPNKIMEEDVEELLMLLSIQDEPIEFLVSILK